MSLTAQQLVAQARAAVTEIDADRLRALQADGVPVISHAIESLGNIPLASALALTDAAGTAAGDNSMSPCGKGACLAQARQTAQDLQPGVLGGLACCLFLTQ